MDWTILWWLLAALVVVAGLVGTVVPALPGPPLVFVGLFIGAWIDDFEIVGWGTIGMLGALELVKDKENYIRFDKDDDVGMICRTHCFDNGLVMRAVGDTMIISPPLILSHENIDQFIELSWKCLDLTHQQVK